MKPLVSVVMPVYNAGRMTLKSVRSILNQTFSNFEFIIVNDGSTDQTAQILENFARSDARIRVLQLARNQGYTKAITLGLTHASGKYLARMDADDYSNPRRLACQVEILDRHPEIVAVGTWTTFVDNWGLKVLPYRPPVKSSEIDRLHMNFPRNPVIGLIHSSVLMRKSSFEIVGGYDHLCQPAEDLDLWLKLAEVGELVNVPELLHTYRLRRDSVTWSGRDCGQINKIHSVVSSAYHRRSKPCPFKPIKVDLSAEELQTIYIGKWAMWARKNRNYAAALRWTIFLKSRKIVRTLEPVRQSVLRIFQTSLHR